MAKLTETRRGWAETTPATCPNGHALEPGSYLVGVQVCGGLHSGDHRTYTCHQCGATRYEPATGSSCRILHGAAGVRNL